MSNKLKRITTSRIDSPLSLSHHSKKATYAVKKQIEFCYGHRLLDYESPCKNIHGHNGKVEIELESEYLDRQGMVADFIEVGHIIKSWLDQNIDHKLLLRKDDPLIPLLRTQKEPFFVTDENPTAEHIAELIFNYACDKKLPVRSVTLWETEHAAAVYRRYETNQ